MILARISILAVLLAIMAVPAFAQEAEPSLAELWETGSLWEVGDNRARVKEARQALIDAGDEGLAFALTKLDAADTLHIRCLRGVIRGFGAKSFDGLVANIAHDKSAARRNVAELLGTLDDKRAAEPLLEQARVEKDMSARLAQLSSLSKWENVDAIPLVIELSRGDTDRIRHRVTSLLARYEQRDAVFRLIEMLDDDIYYVRDGARAGLAKGKPAARSVCFARFKTEFELPANKQSLQRLRLLMPIFATLAEEDVPEILALALKHQSGLVRGDAAAALVKWKQGAGLIDTEHDVKALLNAAIDAEYDPYAKTSIELARDNLNDADKK